MLVPAHLLGAVFGVVLFKTLLPFIPNEVRFDFSSPCFLLLYSLYRLPNVLCSGIGAVPSTVNVVAADFSLRDRSPFLILRHTARASLFALNQSPLRKACFDPYCIALSAIQIVVFQPCDALRALVCGTLHVCIVGIWLVAD